eukprot:gene14338-biopygen4894
MPSARFQQLPTHHPSPHPPPPLKASARAALWGGWGAGISKRLAIAVSGMCCSAFIMSGYRMAIHASQPTVGASCGHPRWPWGRPATGASYGHPWRHRMAIRGGREGRGGIVWPSVGVMGASYGHPWGPWGPWGHRMAIRGGIVWPSVGASYGHPWRHRMAIRGGRGGRGGIVWPSVGASYGPPWGHRMAIRGGSCGLFAKLFKLTSFFRNGWWGGRRGRGGRLRGAPDVAARLDDVAAPFARRAARKHLHRPPRNPQPADSNVLPTSSRRSSEASAPRAGALLAESRRDPFRRFPDVSQTFFRRFSGFWGPGACRGSDAFRRVPDVFPTFFRRFPDAAGALAARRRDGGVGRARRAVRDASRARVRRRRGVPPARRGRREVGPAPPHHPNNDDGWK